MRHLNICLALLSAATALTAHPIVLNGGFEEADPANAFKPAHWDQPDGLGVQWTNSVDTAHGKAIRFNTAITEVQLNEQCKKSGVEKWIIPNPTGSPVGENYGLSLYSAAMPVKKGQPYKITFDFKGPSGGAKMWVRGYAEFEGEKRRRWETTVETRVANPKEWTTISQEFFPTKMRDVSEMKVMLYAFYPSAVYWFDNVKIEPITVQEYEELRKIPAPAAHGRKPKLPPSEAK